MITDPHLPDHSDNATAMIRCFWHFCGRTAVPLLETLLVVGLGMLVGDLSADDIPKPIDAPVPKSPQDSAASFVIPPGFRMEAVVSEPLIESPTAICWDERGRVFVGELHGYNLEGQLDIESLNKTGKLDNQVRRVEAADVFKKAAKKGTYGVVKMLSSSRHDGHLDTVRIWASDLPPVYGLIPARGGVIVACAPSIVFLADRSGTGTVDTRETLFDGFGVGELWRGINCPVWNVDGWIYFGQGWPGGAITGPRLAHPVRLPQSDFRIRADGTMIEPVTGATGTFGFAVNEAGDRFVTGTTQPANFVPPLPYHYLMRNPDAAISLREVQTGDPHAYARAKPHPWRQKRADDPAYFKFYHDAYGAAESEPDGWFTAACGPMIYEDDALPGLHGEYFVCEPALNLIHRSHLVHDGSVLRAQRAPGEEHSEFLASTDIWSHPIHLAQGPDGAIWVVDFYREIIEDYSASPRHLQQQYGVYNGHERGRVYRLAHADMPAAPSPDMSRLTIPELVRELASPLSWRRMTAERLISERTDRSQAAAGIRTVLAAQGAPATTVIALRTLSLIGDLTPGDLLPWFDASDPSIRIHCLQLADAFLRTAASAPLLAHICDAAAMETDPRVQIQFALTLGESDDQRTLQLLARYARDHLAVRWMDAAVMSSIHGRGTAMLAELVRDPGTSTPLFPQLARSIAANREDATLAQALHITASAPPDVQVVLLNAFVAGRHGAPGLPLSDSPSRTALAPIANSSSAPVRTAAHALEDTFQITAAPPPVDLASLGGTDPSTGVVVSDATFRTYVAALASPRNAQRGHDLFLQNCSMCHRIKKEGTEVGPDILGEMGAEETLIRDILLPSERIRAGYETTLASTSSGTVVMGLLKEDGPTSVTLVGPGGVEQVLLRKDVTGVRRIATSLMPPFGGLLAPVDVADILAWLRSNLGSDTSSTVVLLDEQPDFATRFTEGDGSAAMIQDGAARGHWCLHVTAPQRAASQIPGWDYHIVEHPKTQHEYRYLRWLWRGTADGVMIELATAGHWPKAEDAAGRYYAGTNKTGWNAMRVTTELPQQWQTVTVDLWKDLGDTHLTGFAPTSIGGESWFDRMELLGQLGGDESAQKVHPDSPTAK